MLSSWSSESADPYQVPDYAVPGGVRLKRGRSVVLDTVSTSSGLPVCQLNILP